MSSVGEESHMMNMKALQSKESCNAVSEYDCVPTTNKSTKTERESLHLSWEWKRGGFGMGRPHPNPAPFSKINSHPRPV